MAAEWSRREPRTCSGERRTAWLRMRWLVRLSLTAAVLVEADQDGQFRSGLAGGPKGAGCEARRGRQSAITAASRTSVSIATVHRKS